MKSYYKYELARAAGVSCKTFQRWLSQNTQTLSEMGVASRTKLLPPKVVKWICDQYGIDEDEL